MKRITQYILVLTIVSVSLLSACRGGSSTNAAPNADHLVEFDKQGIALLRGQVTSASATAGQNTEILTIHIPARMDGMDVIVAVTFTLRNETLVSSSLIKQTDLLEYLSFHKGSSAFEAFPANALVDVTFKKTGTTFIASAIQEVTKKSLFPKRTVIDPLFTTEGFGEGTLQGTILQTRKQNNGTVRWTVSVPLTMQGVEIAVLLPVQSAVDTNVIPAGNTIKTVDTIRGKVKIDFVRSSDTLTARQVTEIP